MNNFPYAMWVLTSWEGGYSQVNGDPGGETYCGISRHFHPDWDGWSVVDAAKPLHWNEIIPDLGSKVVDFYESTYWNKFSYRDIQSDEIAAKIFQHHVNMGVRAIKLLQEEFYQLPVDGILGPLTVSKINASGGFLRGFCELLHNYYGQLIADHPQFEKFRHEWLLRADTIGVRPVQN